MEETKEKSKNKCQYCGKEYKNVSVHERFCKLNPEIRKANVQHEKDKEQPKESQQEQKPLIISDVQQVVVDKSDDLPWFVDENGNRKPEIFNFIGIHENIPCVLVMNGYGQLMPVYLFKGFIGMFPKYHEFPEAKQEPQPKEESPKIASTETIISSLEEEKFEQVITPEPIHAQTEKKKSLFGGLFGKKEKTTETTNSSAELAKRIIEASNEPKPT